MKNYLFLLALPLLVACSLDDNEPELIIDPVDVSGLVGTWEVTDISNVYEADPKPWDHWQDYYGKIYIKFNSDLTCDTYYEGSSMDLAESMLPKFPYVFSRYKLNSEGKIICFNPDYSEITNALLVVKTYTGNNMEVVLEDGMYSMLSSTYPHPQLYLKLKRQS